MSEWEVLTLGDCADWYSGGTPKTSVSEYWGGDIPWITASSLHNFYIRDSERRVTPLGLENGTRLVPKDTILFVVRGMSLKTEFRVGITCCPVTFGQDCKALIPKAGIAPLFLANVLRGRAEEILGLVDEASHGTGRLATDVLKDFKVWIPPLEEQARIAAVLSCLDRKIENLRRQNETLEQIAQTLFKHWFVDFEFPNADGKPYKSSGGVMVPSELGEIPAGWRIGKLKDICQIINGFAFKSKDYRESGIKIIRTKNFNEAGFIEPNDLVYISEDQLDKYKKFELHKSDFLMVMVGASIGKFVTVTSHILPALQNQNMWNFRAINREKQLFLNQSLKLLISQHAKSSTGSAREFFRKDYFYKISITLPQEDVLLSFVKLSVEMAFKIDLNIRQIQTLTKTRDVLLPRLMSGKLRVSGE